jgi:hypothetical protein
MAGFDATQVAALDATAFAGFDRNQVAALNDAAMAGFDATQVAALDPNAMSGFDITKVASLDAAAMRGIKAEQIENLSAASFAGLDSEKMGNLDKKALESVSVEQFAALDDSALTGLKSENLGGLSPEVFGSMSEEELASLNPEEVQKMEGQDFAKLVTNLNEFSVETETVANLLPEGWTLEDDGDLKAPPGAGLSFASLESSSTEGESAPKVAAQPDLSTDLSIGGGSGATSVLDGMDAALESANVGELGFAQSPDGILNVGGAEGPPVAAFITDTANMVQAAEDAQPGISVDEDTGGYVVITEQGYQIPLKPAVADPVEIAELLPDSELEIGEAGQTSITNFVNEEGAVSNITGIPNSILEETDLSAGTYTSGTGADAEIKIVYEDGTAQTLKPAIKDQEGFNTAASSIPGVENVVPKVDGSIKLTFEGQDIVLRPLFEIVQGEPGATTEPKIDQEGDRYFLYSSDGSKQEFVIGS